MPNRILREGIIESELVDDLDWAAEVFYRRLMSVVDDFGRFTADPTILRARCYPRRVDKITTVEVAAWLHACADPGLIQLYSVDGKDYLVLHKLGQPRAKVSKFPAPPPLANKNIRERGPTHESTREQTLARENICEQTQADACTRKQTHADENICLHVKADACTCAQTQTYVPYSDSYSNATERAPVRARESTSSSRANDYVSQPKLTECSSETERLPRSSFTAAEEEQPNEEHPGALARESAITVISASPPSETLAEESDGDEPPLPSLDACMRIVNSPQWREASRMDEDPDTAAPSLVFPPKPQQPKKTMKEMLEEWERSLPPPRETGAGAAQNSGGIEWVVPDPSRKPKPTPPPRPKQSAHERERECAANLERSDWQAATLDKGAIRTICAALPDLTGVEIAAIAGWKLRSTADVHNPSAFLPRTITEATAIVAEVLEDCRAEGKDPVEELKLLNEHGIYKPYYPSFDG